MGLNPGMKCSDANRCHGQGIVEVAYLLNKLLSAEQDLKIFRVGIEEIDCNFARHSKIQVVCLSSSRPCRRGTFTLYRAGLAACDLAAFLGSRLL